VVPNYVDFFKGTCESHGSHLQESLENIACITSTQHARFIPSLSWDQAVSAVGSEQAAMTSWAPGQSVPSLRALIGNLGLIWCCELSPTKPERYPALPPRYLWLHGWRTRSCGMPGLASYRWLHRKLQIQRCHQGGYVRTHKIVDAHGIP